MVHRTGEKLPAVVYTANGHSQSLAYQETEADREYMGIAIEEAQQAFEAGNYPVGAVLVNAKGDLWKAHALEHSGNQLRGHAEGRVIDQYNYDTGRRLLDDLSMYVNYVPCVGCSYFIDQGELGMLYFAADREDVIAATSNGSDKPLVRQKGINMPDILHESPRTMMVVKGLIKAASVELFVRKHQRELAVAEERKQAVRDLRQR